MKQFLRFGFLTALLAISGWGYAQSTIDFELVGNDWTWSAFENGANTDGSFTVVANPDATGINTSATVGKMIVNADGAIYAGAQSKHGEDIVPFSFDANNSTITMMVYKSVISPVGLKFAESNNEAQPEVKVSNTKTNEWEELTFDLSGSIGKGITGIIDQIIIFPDFPDTRTEGSVCYVDNITFGTGAPSLNISKFGFTFEAAGGDKTLNLGTAIGWTAASDQTWLILSSASGTGDAAITLTAAENTTVDPRSATVTITGGDASTQTVNILQDGKPALSTPAPTPPTRNDLDVISIFSDAYTSLDGTNFNPNWGQNTAVTTVKVGTDNVLKYANLNYQGTEYSDQDVSLMDSLHIDVWSADETSLQLYCISRSTGEKFVQLTPINLSAWNSYDIALSEYTSQSLSVSDLFQFKIVGSGGKTVYFDNIYFYKTASTGDTEAPAAFTAIVGTLTYESVELLLNATDNSGSVTYNISYGDGPTVLTTTGTSGVEKSYVVTGLAASTTYSFSVTAEDAAGNTATNNPIVVPATTEVNTTGINSFDHSNISIYPNPAESSLFIDGLSEKASVKIFDMGGKLLVKKQNVSKGIDVENFTKGVYFIQIMDNNAVITRKFIKE